MGGLVAYGLHCGMDGPTRRNYRNSQATCKERHFCQTDNPNDDTHAVSRSKMRYPRAGIYDNLPQIEARAGSSVCANKERLGLEHGKIRRRRNYSSRRGQ